MAKNTATMIKLYDKSQKCLVKNESNNKEKAALFGVWDGHSLKGKHRKAE